MPHFNFKFLLAEVIKSILNESVDPNLQFILSTLYTSSIDNKENIKMQALSRGIGGFSGFSQKLFHGKIVRISRNLHTVLP